MMRMMRMMIMIKIAMMIILMLVMRIITMIMVMIMKMMLTSAILRGVRLNWGRLLWRGETRGLLEGRMIKYWNKNITKKTKRFKTELLQS